MEVKSPDDEEAEEYGEYSRYIQIQEQVESNIASSTGVVYTVPKRVCSAEDFDDKYAKLETDDNKVHHVITGKGLAYAIPNKTRPGPRECQEEDAPGSAAQPVL